MFQYQSHQLSQLTKNDLVMRLQQLSKISGACCSEIQQFRLFVLKEQCIYQELNNMQYNSKILQGKFWAPKQKQDEIYRSLDDLAKKSPNIPSAQIHQIPNFSGAPPTYVQTNQFTCVFQEIVNTYGIPRYQEINPGLFTIITFPFLFGVMFGDIAHGFIIMTVGLYLIMKKAVILDNPNSLLYPMINYRYILALMGFFACYCGFIYNDFTSLFPNIFGSCYNPIKLKSGDGRNSSDCVYPFGIDPIWGISSNNLLFLNSHKMKFAVIFGVAHMTFGILMKGWNSLYFQKYLDFFFQFIPQLCFMICTFIYMDYMIIYKWLNHDFINTESGALAPSIITMMINIPLQLGHPGSSLNGNKPLFGNRTGEDQQDLQIRLLVVAVICVPLILIPKPLITYYQNKKNVQNPRGNKLRNGSEDNEDDRYHHEIGVHAGQDNEQGLKQINIEMGHHNPENDLVNELQMIQSRAELENQHIIKKNSDHDGDFGQLIVHQIIETIEFVLGSISNTASYLRLWALSLAHGQLSEVFFYQSMLNDIIDHNYSVKIIFFFAQKLIYPLLFLLNLDYYKILSIWFRDFRSPVANGCYGMFSSCFKASLVFYILFHFPKQKKPIQNLKGLNFKISFTKLMGYYLNPFLSKNLQLITFEDFNTY